MKKNRQRVVVAMSGGVDSSVAAALLNEQGYDVVGVMLHLWSEAQSAADNRCCSLESIHDARAVANTLGIPFYVVNAEGPFKEAVVDFFVAEYAAGCTPNPCLTCNRKIRFGFLLRYARTLGAEYLATGHYVRVAGDEASGYRLLRGVDRAKDQSYVLSVLGQADLAQALFPVGGYSKTQVRALAAARGLPTASREESQDLCFVADGDYRRFLVEHAPDAVVPGPVLDRAGLQLGTHRGLPFYTVGQRSGLGIAAAQPLYVLELDLSRNALIVGAAAELDRTGLRVRRMNWIAGEPPSHPIAAQVQIRYHAVPAAATIMPLSDAEAEVTFAAPQRGVSAGQAAVFYDGQVCLGGGVIAR